MALCDEDPVFWPPVCCPADVDTLSEDDDANHGDVHHSLEESDSDVPLSFSCIDSIITMGALNTREK